MQVTFACWVYATAASTARIRVLWGSSSYESHDYHSGDDQWEYQEINVNVPSTAAEITAVLEVADAGTARFDASHLHIAPIYRYTIPSAIVHGPHYVTQQADIFHPEGPYHPIVRETEATPGRILRFEGLGILTRRRVTLPLLR